MDLPPFTYRPIIDTRMEIPVADQSMQPILDGICRSIQITFLSL